MGCLYWIAFDAFELRAKDLNLDDDESASLWAKMSDPTCEDGDEAREMVWGKDLELFGEYVDKAIEARRKDELI